MHAATLHTAGQPGGRLLANPTSALKGSVDVTQIISPASSGKGRKRERADHNPDPIKQEKYPKPNDPNHDRTSSKLEDISILADSGLEDPDSVDSLVHVMKQDQINGSRKPSEVSLQRAMLAGVISATVHHDCLRRFVELGVLSLLDEWLQEAHRGSKSGESGSPQESNDRTIEDLVLALLKALEKLPVDLVTLKSCLIGKSVNNLRGHRNTEIQKKARRLVEVWKKQVNSEMRQSVDLKHTFNHYATPTLKHTIMPDSIQSSVCVVQAPSVDASLKSFGGFAGNMKQGSSNQAGTHIQLSPSPNFEASFAGKSNSASASHDMAAISTSKSNIATPKVQLSVGSQPLSSTKEQKPQVWIGSSTPNKGDKGGIQQEVSPVEPLSNHRFIVRIPNPVRSPAQAFSGGSIVDPPVPSSAKSSSPSRPASSSGDVKMRSTTDSKRQRVFVKTESENNPRTNETANSSVDDKHIMEDNGSLCGDASEAPALRDSTTVFPDLAAAAGINLLASVAATESLSDDDIPASPERSTVLEGLTASSEERQGSVHGSPGAMNVSPVDRMVLEEQISDRSAGQSSLIQKGVGSSGEMATSAGCLAEKRRELPVGDDDGSILRLDLHSHVQIDPASKNTQSLPKNEPSMKEQRANNLVDSNKGVIQDPSDAASRSEFPSPSNDKKDMGSQEQESSSVKMDKQVDEAETAERLLEEDALEVARQVAQEVEKEMESYDRVYTERDELHTNSHSSPKDCIATAAMVCEGKDSSRGQGDNGNPSKRLSACSSDSSFQLKGGDPTLTSGEPDENHSASMASKQMPQISSHPDHLAVNRTDIISKPAELSVRPVFDLNEGFIPDEAIVLSSLTRPPSNNQGRGLTTPIAVLAGTKGPFMIPLQSKGGPGWKGSAATSAFRRAEPRRPLEAGQTANNTLPQSPLPPAIIKSVKPVFDFDLNIADERLSADTVKASFPSTDSGCKTSARPILDLNFIDDCEGNEEAVSQAIDQSPSKRAKSSTPLNFDLNNGPLPDDFEEPRACNTSRLSSSPSCSGLRTDVDDGNPRQWPQFSPQITFPPFTSPLMKSDSPYRISTQQPYPNSTPNNGSMLSCDIYIAGANIPPSVPYSSQGPISYSYSGFPVSFNTSPFPAVASSAFMDTSPVLSANVKPPYLMGLPELNSPAAEGFWARPKLDLNAGPDFMEELRDDNRQISTRPPPIAPPCHVMDTGELLKRKELDGVWNAQRQVFKQPTWH